MLKRDCHAWLLSVGVFGAFIQVTPAQLYADVDGGQHRRTNLCTVPI